VSSNPSSVLASPRGDEERAVEERAVEPGEKRAGID
jgi:hypothetical protein